MRFIIMMLECFKDFNSKKKVAEPQEFGTKPLKPK